ncbi:gluconeogenesis factor YvcK family protein [Adlercreutzia mucosicola]|uniref:Putative gluconeogenesis factor n=1 Tax=Adlercreutzia mucosicola TaxID=580026 RepID=A0A6N8JK45_9ACTN|nr:gluconeogenesis factor YvcK family protein [Adlercreutzia mucosicola]MCI9495694.1 YvcK family protein [Adlercreutzia mucosicola]MCR2034766.1 YvcK family protein [Adlercreutzia mucosicola]MVX60012.1 uridine diphosphate-N-acetylglucosamine-binding protein YvcK [Adlercreutzia mucosicola]
MAIRKTDAFRVDPAATAAFSALKSALPNLRSLDESDRALRAVVIGGGTGAPVSIRTLLSLGVQTSAVVAMADDGGSTGVLREEADATPPGDIRKCLVAFAKDPSDPLVRALKYRFAVARDHALGNLLLTALEDACGSFPDAIAICERLVNAQGHVYPSTLDHVVLSARTQDGRVLDGQAVACHSRTALESVWLAAEDGRPPRPYEPACQAIREADLIVLGPGSLFTSIIPNLLIPGIVEAIRESRGRVLFVCALADVQGETWGLTAREHFEALAAHGMEGLIDYMLVHSKVPLRAESPATGSFAALSGADLEHASTSDLNDTQLTRGVRPISISYADLLAIQSRGPIVISRNLADAERPTWHSPFALRDAFQNVIKLSRARRG